jgi:hypothetical protein
MADAPRGFCSYEVSQCGYIKEPLRQIRIMKHFARKYQNEEKLFNCGKRRHCVEMSPPDVNIKRVRITEGNDSGEIE